jgi:type IV pilus assembly protein PilY1
VQRHFLRYSVVLASLAGLFVVSDANAQISGTTQRPLPDILLLVDNSGSMERKPDNTTPNCIAGDSTSEVNRWGMLIQALTGNIQPYFSCGAVDRSSTTFSQRYQIAGKPPYDVGYSLNYYMPLSGTGSSACALAPWKVPGAPAGQGVGSAGLSTGTFATDFPDDALQPYLYSALGTGLPATLDPASICNFDQSNDGQLDVSMNYARFALMTFDPSTDQQTGLTAGNTIDTTNPFKGIWSYLRLSANEYYGSTSNFSAALGYGAQGSPGVTPACPPTMQEVGARNSGAPPWEGRLVNFAAPDASIYDLAAQNQQVQKVLAATRPYGATPIDGMFDDARDYMWNDPAGPNKDPYTCRDKYIILLTDGAPNLDLRPMCEATNGICPYPKKAGDTAYAMNNAATAAQKVKTYVIGFSVNGNGGPDGFPASLLPTERNCKTWFDKASSGAANDKDAATKMQAACTATPPATGTTGAACCKLNEIALMGGDQGAYFAESQADVVLSFGRIMANIIHSASTKTIPGYTSPTAYGSAAFQNNATSTQASAAQFIASYIPSSETPWAGEIDRSRISCNATNTGETDPSTVVEDTTKGDSQAVNVASQAGNKQRLFISFKADEIGTAIDSAATIRPFVASGSDTGGDKIGQPGSPSTKTAYTGVEVAMNDYTLAFTPNWFEALNITKNTCKRGRAVKTGGSESARGTTEIPALNGGTGAADCTDAIWGFATATPDSITKTGSCSTGSCSFDFNIRCHGTSITTGVCSISGAACNPQAAGGCNTGETCIPQCAALGAVFHSNPAVIPPPQGYMREEGFRQYQQNRSSRRTTLYAATTDGLLHAFKALEQSAPLAGMHEMWSFVPPAVLPRLASNYPQGNQILLDGAPIVRETVWDRRANGTSADPTIPPSANWHSTLVAGFGTFGGYYAVNVTDSDCGGTVTTGECLANYQVPDKGDPASAGASGDTTSSSKAKKGPHFLWQLTDIPAETSSEPGAIVRQTPVTTGTYKNQVALFGQNTGTPAVGILQVKTVSDGEHQIGVAILPGGYQDPPTKPNGAIAAGNGACARGTQPAGGNLSDQGVRGYVRQWAKKCTDPVPGRNLTIVRLDTGEVLRVFGRLQDTPADLADKVAGTSLTETVFDSPIVGTPVVYPDQPGVPIQKIFVGDADGTLWKIDVTSTNPKDWTAYLFQDLIGTITGTSNESAAALSEPIMVPPALAADNAGQVIVNAATGDQESIVWSATELNYLFSIRDGLDSSFKPKTQTLWYKQFDPAERVTGPMTVFDKTVYFATYLPTQPTSGGSCDGLGKAFLWGLDYITPASTISTGGAPKWCNGTIDGAGNCSNPTPTDKVQNGTDLIPGVALRASQACFVPGGTDEYGNGTYASVSQSSYSLTFGIAAPRSSGVTTQANRASKAQPLPKISTKIASWAIVLE